MNRNVSNLSENYIYDSSYLHTAQNFQENFLIFEFVMQFQDLNIGVSLLHNADEHSFGKTQVQHKNYENFHVTTQFHAAQC